MAERMQMAVSQTSRRYGMSHFREKYETRNTGGLSGSRGIVGVLEPVDLFLGNDSVSASKVVVTMRELIEDCAVKEVKEVSDPQICAYLYSMIINILPGLTNEADISIHYMGGKVQRRTMPTDEGVTAVTLVADADVHPAKVLIYFFQAVLVLFKNIDARSYNNYMTSGVNAAQAVIRMPVPVGRPNDVLAFKLEDAKILRTVGGSASNFRAKLV